MFDLRKILFGAPAASESLPPAIRAEVTAWLALPDTKLEELNFHTRYVVLDVAGVASGEAGGIQSVAAAGLHRGGSLLPDDVLAFDPPGAATDTPEFDRQLAAFLRFVGKSPVVTFHAPFALGVLQKACKARLGVDYAPPCIDLVWLLPSLFEEIAAKPQSLDQWLECFGVEALGRRDAMGNVLQLARLFQRVLARGHAGGLDTPSRLIEESQASTFLRRTH